MTLTLPARMSSALPEIHRIQIPFGYWHVLVDSGRAVILDAGLAPRRGRVRRLFSEIGLEPSSVDALLLTHGHLDHTGNLAWLKEWTGAPVVAHAAEQVHIDGGFSYRGVAHVCGALEAAGRRVFRYRAVSIDRTISDGELLPWWGGLRVIHLPGHTHGHCGFWSERHRLLFAGDLVAIWTWRSTFPPAIFNSAGHRLRESLRKAAALRPQLVVPNHYNRADPAWMAERFAAFAERELRPYEANLARA